MVTSYFSLEISGEGPVLAGPSCFDDAVDNGDVTTASECATDCSSARGTNSAVDLFLRLDAPREAAAVGEVEVLRREDLLAFQEDAPGRYD